MFNKTKATKHETSACPWPYIYLYRVLTTLNISADILDFQTSGYSRLIFSTFAAV